MKQNNYVKHLKEIAFDMSVLLVEDDLELQNQLKLFLNRFFGRVDTASNGIKAFKTYKNSQYDLVITDLTMPFMGGVELTENIHLFNNHQKIIIISALAESDKLIELINMGIEAFILKPIDLNRVLIKLNKICQRIYDHKMLDHFYTMLEDDNVQG